MGNCFTDSLALSSIICVTLEQGNDVLGPQTPCLEQRELGLDAGRQRSTRDELYLALISFVQSTKGWVFPLLMKP